MINYDTLFDDENKDILAKLEAESAGILGRLEGKAGTGNSALDLIRTDKEYRSPFMDANNVPLGANLLTDISTSTFAFTGLDQYGNAGYEYLVATVPCDDGAKVFSKYERTSVQKHELYLFYENEKPEKNNLFGNFYIAKMGDSFSGLIRKFLDSPTPYKIPGTIEGQAETTTIQNYDTLTTYVQKLAKKQHTHDIKFNPTHNAIEREYLSKTPTGKIYEGLSSIDEVIAKGLDWCADGLEYFIIKEKSYIPSDNYTPIIKQSRDKLGPENLVANLFEDAVNSPFAKDVQAAIGEANNFIITTLNRLGWAVLDALPEPIQNIIKKLHGLVQQLKTGLDTILQSVGDFLKAVGGLVIEVLQFTNAFLCGIINGITSTVQVIIHIEAFLVNMMGMDADYKSYLKRRDVGEKIESVLDFITESVSSIITAIVSLYTSPIKTTVKDIARFIYAIASLFEKVGGSVADFFKNTSSYKYAYYAGFAFFEICINILLLALTGGLGNIAKAATFADKILAGLKIFGQEAFSVITFGVVDILALFKSLIGAFVRACSKGLKGFLRWIEELIKGFKSDKAKSVDELLEDAERGAAFIKRGRYLGQVLEDIDIEKIKIFLKKRNVDFQIGPGDGIFEVDGFFYASGNLFKMEAKNAALFITDGTKMKLVLRENATLYELLHELMHYNHCKTLGIKKYYDLGKQGINGTILREKYVFDKMVENAQYLNRAELEHAGRYINTYYSRFGITDKLGNPIIEKIPFELNKIPLKRQEVNIDKILSL